ncbi:hypothetical protein [Stigmatella aurantiaca]|uniref:Lipoprotein n=1 Tax=Stigmatella aurantiaca (strain DW4/3-1) TaxID=378806 RepID=Q09A42_STIAD|nr:hypothetical protein [Stigmatella aurantiaca]ADO68903.1 uncharacterized protein STAUR_1099 [Stigmatella aurantiaca DW4/3-1]EAU68563.1 hypothetical protein STIAU_8808 [Stigmatella aurantiaca DW4/3-1]
MSRLHRYLFVAALGIGASACRSVGPSAVQLPETLDERLVESARTCVTRLNRDRERAQNAMLTSDFLLLLGTTAGAAGSLLAAFLTKPLTRRTSAVVGAVGALTAAATKTLDDPAEILTLRSRAERHWVVGYKVFTQMTLAYSSQPLVAEATVVALTGESAKAALSLSDQQRQRALVYVLDRFIDCSAALPAESFEELPSSGFFAIDEGMASRRKKAPERPSAAPLAEPAPLQKNGQSVLIYAEPEAPKPEAPAGAAEGAAPPPSP